MPTRSSKRLSDPNQLAKLMADIATGQAEDSWVDPATGKNAAAVALGRLGGKKGGIARKNVLTPEQRTEIARAAAVARWKKSEN